MTRYSYFIREIDGDFVEHELAGEVRADSMQDAVTASLRESYMTLTGGKTEFGKPGQGRCRGPYTVVELTLRNEDV